MANKPNNPALWSRAKSMAKSKFDVYPSAYANGWAAKWYKSKGGTWRKAEYGMEVMGDGGTPDNPGFNALPPAVQQKIIDNMAEGGEKMPPEIARARFAAAGNLDKMGDYGYAYGGYIPEMMYGGFDYMEEGGEPNGGMALGQMSAVADKMSKLRQFVSPEQNLDPWIASKLAVMDHSADAISDYMMYNPEAQGGGEEMEQEDMEEMMANGGYVVTRSNDRKGKTHKVTGPDGTVKYFGDSKLGQHPKDPERKAAFYARHKKNLENNPFFRAFARKTWKEGGSTYSGNAFYQDGGEPQLENYPDYGSYRADLYRYNAGQMANQAQQVPMEEQKVMWHPEWEEQGIDPEMQNSPRTITPASASTANVAPTTVAPKIDYNGVSIVDLLQSTGKASDYNSRKQLAEQLGIDGYYGSAKQNLELVKKITSNPAVLNDYKPVASPSKPRSNPRAAAVASTPASTSVSTGANNVPGPQPGYAPATNQLSELFAASKKYYLDNNPGMTSADYDAMMAANDRRSQTTIGPAANPLPYRSSSEPYDDSYMLNKIANDPETPGNVRKRKQKDFAMNMGAALLAALVPNIGITRYYPLLRGLPQFANVASKGAKALPSGVRALPQAAKALPKPGPTNWITNSGLSFEMGGSFPMEEYKQGGINLDPAKKGTFKAQATRMGMGVQEAASAILNAPEGKYSPAMRKKANFAKNFAKQMGGPVEGEVLDVSPEQLEMLRQQGYQFEIM
jgi:hypothetical protein